MVQGLPHGWHVWRKNLSFQPSFSDFNSRNLFSFSSIFLNNHPITDDRMLSVSEGSRLSLCHYITGSFLRIHFDKFGGLSSWKFFLDISTILNEVLIPFFSSGEYIVCVEIFYLWLLGFIFISFKSLRGPPSPSRKKREKGVIAVFFIFQPTRKTQYLVAPQSVRVSFFSLLGILYSFSEIRPPCGDGPPWLWVRKKNKIKNNECKEGGTSDVWRHPAWAKLQR